MNGVLLHRPVLGWFAFGPVTVLVCFFKIVLVLVSQRIFLLVDGFRAEWWIIVASFNKSRRVRVQGGLVLRGPWGLTVVWVENALKFVLQLSVN